MLPIRDANPSFIRPFITWAILALCTYVFFAVQPHTEREAVVFLYQSALVPCEVTGLDPLSAAEIETGRCDSGEGNPVFPEKGVLLALVTSMFFHGGIAHLLGNLWVLWIFGNNVEEAFGHFGYLAFYLATGLVASLAHVVLNPSSTVPVVGASGAIAGVMGAYLILFPGARVVSIIPPLFFLPIAVPAFLFLGFWFLGQFALAGAATNIAWEAHVGGFLAGMGAAVWGRRRLLQRVEASRHRAFRP
ncbi:MAG: rhomboid family intramembrane serine protease [Acidimicrobiia bacterium]